MSASAAEIEPASRVQPRPFYPALDGLRAFALLLVFLQHYLRLPWGWTGVQIFFVLSGFLITGILFDTVGPGAEPRPHPVRDFYLRRTLRIFPLYYAVWLLVLLLAPAMHWSWSAWWLAWPLYLGNFLRFVSPAALIHGTPQLAAGNAALYSRRFGFTLNLGHFWSLCVEEQFYLLWPWIVMGTRLFGARGRSILLWLCIAVVVLGAPLRMWAAHVAPAWMLGGELLYRLLPFQLDSLLLGGLIALLWRMADRGRLLRLAGYVVALTALLAVAYLACTLHLGDPDWREAYVYPAWVFTWGLSFVNLMAAAFIVCCLRAEGRISRSLSVAPLRWIGRVSYGAYVFHDIPHDFYVRTVARGIGHLARSSPFVLRCLWPQHDLITAIVAFLCTLLLAALSYRFLEKPFLNLKATFQHPKARVNH